MGNVQGNPNQNRALTKPKRSLRLKSRVISKLVSSTRKYSSKENSPTIIDDADHDFSTVFFTPNPNVSAYRANQSLELDIQNASGNVKAKRLQDWYTPRQTYESELTTFSDGMSIFIYLSIFIMVCLVCFFIFVFAIGLLVVFNEREFLKKKKTNHQSCAVSINMT